MSPQWQKSSFSGIDAEDCVEAAHAEGHLLLRESDTPHATLTVTPEGLAALIRTCKAARRFPVLSTAAS
ncbi:DUF397 domain-containing protein [Streptomyces sp. NPDC058308]|uniref:DUF397 domain-containing protein n=1 Tax=Streptomyces sp. NPDC058308 TaxID=3346440 RepID=UPI0036EF8764